MINIYTQIYIYIFSYLHNYLIQILIFQVITVLKKMYIYSSQNIFKFQGKLSLLNKQKKQIK